MQVMQRENLDAMAQRLNPPDGTIQFVAQCHPLQGVKVEYIRDTGLLAVDCLQCGHRAGLFRLAESPVIH